MAFPSDEQKAVITSDDRRLVVVAAPGTGKTKTIVERIIRLLTQDHERAISLLTFTRTSRRDSDRKLRDTVDQKKIDVAEGGIPRVSTLHGFAKALIHRKAVFFGRTSEFGVLLADTGEPQLLVSDVVKDLNLPVKPDQFYRAIVDHRALSVWPGYLKLDVDRRTEGVERFEAYLRFYDAFDMDGLVSAACLVLKHQGQDIPPIMLQVDEYQDLNPNDQQLVKLAGGSEASRIVVVGDDAQSIYGFRHANPAGIRELWESGDWRNIHFPECHRLPVHVLLAANSLIRDRGYLGGEIALPKDDGCRLLTLQCTTSDVQIQAVAKEIERLKAGAKRSDGEPLTYGDFMVLCPSRNHVGQAANRLGELGIPVRPPPGGIPEDIWLLLLILRMLREDNLALRQWLDLIGLLGAEVQEIRSTALREAPSLFDHCRTLRDERIAGLLSHLDTLAGSLGEPGHFAEALAAFPGLPESTDVSNMVEEIIQFAPSVGSMILRVKEKYGVLDSNEDASDEPVAEDVLVTTMHSAKGLEAEFVFLMWMNDTFIPAANRDPVEEERVFYVALTRAKQDAILTFHERYEKGKPYVRAKAMSPFLVKIKKHLAITRVTAADLK